MPMETTKFTKLAIIFTSSCFLSLTIPPIAYLLFANIQQCVTSLDYTLPSIYLFHNSFQILSDVLQTGHLLAHVVEVLLTRHKGVDDFAQ